MSMRHQTTRPSAKMTNSSCWRRTTLVAPRRESMFRVTSIDDAGLRGRGGAGYCSLVSAAGRGFWLPSSAAGLAFGAGSWRAGGMGQEREWALALRLWHRGRAAFSAGFDDSALFHRGGKLVEHFASLV